MHASDYIHRPNGMSFAKEKIIKTREKIMYFCIDSNLYIQYLILFQNHLTTESVIHPFRCLRRSHLLII